MTELIMVDRQDGLAVAGLLTAVLAHWDGIPLPVQASIIEHASLAAFNSMGRTDGRYLVAAFVLKHRAAMAREARQSRGPKARIRDAVERWSEAPRQMARSARQWPVAKWLTSMRKTA